VVNLMTGAGSWTTTRREATVKHPSSATPARIAGSGTAVVGRTTWEKGFAWKLFALDVVASTLAIVTAMLLGLHSTTSMFHGSYGLARLIADCILVLGWPAMLALSRAYELRYLGFGTEEFRFVISAAVRLLAGIAALVFLFDIAIYPAYVAYTIGVCLVASLLLRFLARKRLHHERTEGRYLRKVLVIGSTDHVQALADHLGSVQYAGLQIVGALGADSGPTPEPITSPQGDITFVDPAEGVLGAIEAVGADTVALADSETLSGDDLRHLAWALEDTGIDLLVAPAVIDVAGPRIVIRPIGGLPLLYVEEPEFTGVSRLTKALVDRVIAFVGLVMLLIPFLITAVAIKVTSRGPVFYRQRRVGIRGDEFNMLKFRSMVRDADKAVVDMADANEASGLMFKIKDDPRITKVGGFLRKHSIDELPQILNVLMGQMSLVGPRPPLPSEVADYGDDVRRRLLVKPGMTGLWQVSGRSDLSWDETVRLDLSYVENWSPVLDLQILWKTVPAVMHGHGAY
jgi:exopolysaccharide biosynthesis polyprenyl glycosylphosphotransferase